MFWASGSPEDDLHHLMTLENAFVQTMHKTPSSLAHANCTLFCAPTARKRTGSQQGPKIIFWMFDERDFRRSERNCFFSVMQLCVPQCDVFYISLAF